MTFGGLHILGTERHEARKSTTSSEVGQPARETLEPPLFLALDDDLMRISVEKKYPA